MNSHIFTFAELPVFGRLRELAYNSVVWNQTPSPFSAGWTAIWEKSGTILSDAWDRDQKAEGPHG